MFGLARDRFVGIKKVTIHVFSCLIAYLIRYVSNFMDLTRVIKYKSQDPIYNFRSLSSPILRKGTSREQS